MGSAGQRVAIQNQVPRQASQADSRCSGCPLTLPPTVPNFSEAAALTQPVQALLLDEFQDLRLDLLSKLPVGTFTQVSVMGEQRSLRWN